MRVPDVVASRVKLRRSHLGISQRDLATKLTNHGWPIDHTAVARIEGGQRQVNVEEFLLLARALDDTPAAFMVPGLMLHTKVEFAGLTIDSAQLHLWFRGVVDALDEGMARAKFSDVEALNAEMENEAQLIHLAAEFRLLRQALGHDWGGTIFAANRMHATLAAIIEGALPADERARVQRDLVVPLIGDDPQARDEDDA